MDQVNIDRQKAAQLFQNQQEFEQQMLGNLEVMSRTRKGISDTSSSADKPKLTTEGAELADKADRNFRSALQLVWEHRQDSFATSQEVGKFIEGLARAVSDGLLQEGQGLWRTWETKSKQTPISEIPKTLAGFYQEFCQRLETQSDPVATAAWVEQQFDGRIHALADGCGRTTKLLSALVLARNNHPLPNYSDRDEYYQNIEKSFPEREKYYRGLFTEDQGEVR